jgi:hypothetical protein
VERWFNLSGCDNVRDLGGLPTLDGSSTRRGVFLRADSLQALTADDVVALRETFGLRTIVDLRAKEEAAREGRGPLAHEPVDYHNLSFLPGEWVMPDDPRFPTIVKDLDSADRIEHYLDYLRLAGDSVARALHLLAQPTTGPALFHCAAGKDRTGVLAALVLSLVGVHPDAIVADYAQTNERIALVNARLAGRPSYNRSVDPRTLAQLACRPEVMQGFLAGIDAGWGGSAVWARRAGLAEEDLRSLRQVLVG